MKRRFKLLNLLLTIIISVTLSIYILDTTIEIFKYKKEIESTKSKMQENYIEKQKNMIKREVETANIDLRELVERFDKDIYLRLYDYSNYFIDLLEYQNFDDFFINKKDYLSKIFNKEDFEFYIFNDTQIKYPFSLESKENEFKYLFDLYKSSSYKETYIILKDSKKVFYIRPMKDFYFAIGIDKEKKFEKEKDILFNHLSNVKYGENEEGYLFIVDKEGIIVMHPNKSLVGVSTKDLTNKSGEPLYKVVQEAINNPHGKGYYTYVIYDEINDKENEKLSYAIYFDRLGWLVASGLFIENLNKEVLNIEKEVNEVVKRMVKAKLNVLFIIISFYMIILFRLKSYINQDINQFITFFNKAVEENRRIDLSMLRFKEFWDLAKFANIMLTKKIALENELLDIIKLDDLTKIANRRYYFEYLKNTFNYSRNHTNDFSLLMIDIDDFKNINDKYGHNIGDIVLKEFCSVTKKHIRKTDFFARIGGEEFSIIIGHSTKQEGINFAERLLKSVRDSIMEKENKIKITISIGLAQFSEHNVEEGELLKIADEKLYEAKRAGKNKVVF